MKISYVIPDVTNIRESYFNMSKTFDASHALMQDSILKLDALKECSSNNDRNFLNAEDGLNLIIALQAGNVDNVAVILQRYLSENDLYFTDSQIDNFKLNNNS